MATNKPNDMGAEAAVFTLQNKCKNTIWPGILAGSGQPQLMNGGFMLKPNEIVKVTAPKKWSGRFWPRRWCNFDAAGNGNCFTGDCGGKLHCNGAGGAPPATLAEFTLDSPVDFYDVSLVDGYNVRVSIVPLSGTGECKSIRCLAELNRVCPAGLKVKRNGHVVACKSACMAFNTPEFCCTGAYGTPQTCKPTSYSKVFKAVCPTSYSYAYDDPTSTFTCKGADYLIRFC
uniref:Thaumatin-like protein n=1 Tax=Fagus sylvatica TaxID=28930 RepID=A0A2N9FTF4_FAGSY